MSGFITKRYSDAYKVAKGTVGYGTFIKVVSCILAVLAIGGGALIGLSTSNGQGFFVGVVGGLIIGLSGYILGVVVAAQGQMMMAVLDVAVNTSSFAEGEEKAAIFNR